MLPSKQVDKYLPKIIKNHLNNYEKINQVLLKSFLAVQALVLEKCIFDSIQIQVRVEACIINRAFAAQRALFNWEAN